MEIKIGTSILVGARWLIIDEIDNQTLWCIDQDGEEFEINASQIDHIYDNE